MTRKIFGTDGIRGVAGQPPLDPATVEAVGEAAGRVLGASGSTALVGVDTRESGRWIAAALLEGLEAAGVEGHYGGVLPTPAVSHLTHTHGFTFGVVISASHNPYEDNGIKFFSGDGYKLPDATEAAIEQVVEEIQESARRAREYAPLPPVEGVFAREYLDWLASKWTGPGLEGWRIVVDAANGAASALAADLYRGLGAEVTALACSPDGKNINRNCGSLFTELVADEVRSGGAHIGFAFDGDADRCLAVAPCGDVLDGDYILYHEALARQRTNRLPGDLVVGTVMSNLWLEKALTARAVKFHRAPVGDRYVLESLRDRGGVLGGEPSGHVLFLDEATTGDGLLTSLAFARHARDGGGASALTEGIRPFPQVIENIRVAEKPDLEGPPVAGPALRAELDRLGGQGRIVLRYSGTEPLLRLMVEAENRDVVDEIVSRFGGLLRKELGAGGRAKEGS
ncbi:MAG: phosphoglucosamine mutase [Acidobacteriota bacterium]